MILSLLLLLSEPAVASGDQEMFQTQCELTRRLRSLNQQVIPEVAVGPEEPENSK